MQRYFILDKQKNNNIITIFGEDVHHLKNVLRATSDDTFICCNGEGKDYLVQINKIFSDRVECTILEEKDSVGEPTANITIAQSMPKREKFEWMLQKATEIGAVRFLPFTSERTVVKVDEKKADQKKVRWERIVKEAAEQAHRGIVPSIASVQSWQALLKEIKNYSVALIAYEKGGEPLNKSIVNHTHEDIVLIFGPEGGFTEKEVQEAQECGAIPITLGPRILRAETAPLVALSCILYQVGDIS